VLSWHIARAAELPTFDVPPTGHKKDRLDPFDQGGQAAPLGGELKGALSAPFEFGEEGAQFILLNTDKMAFFRIGAGSDIVREF